MKPILNNRPVFLFVILTCSLVHISSIRADTQTDPRTQYLLGAYRSGGKMLFRARVDGSRAPMDAWREQFHTSALTATVPGGSKLIPVFQVAGPQCGHHDSPRTLAPATSLCAGRSLPP